MLPSVTSASPSNDAGPGTAAIEGHLAVRPSPVADRSDGALARVQLGMYVFLASDLMLFAPFFAAYYLLRTNAASWPPPDVTFDVPRAAVATALLVSSSFTLIASDRAAERGAVEQMRRWLMATIALGGLFLANQFAEYTTLSFGPADHTYGSIYWLLTGLHSGHVTIGLITLLALLTRSYRAQDPDALATWTAGVSAFWHLIDVVWIGVFTTIWVIR
jgi:cytochrome c oxidase subunit 3